MSEVKNLSRRLRIAHLFQAPGTNFHEPCAAQLHIFHTMRSLQNAGHHVALVALQGQQMLFTDNLQVFQDAAMVESYFGNLGLSGKKAFKFFESGMRRGQQMLRMPYWALFDSFRIFDGSVQNLKDYDLIHERFNLLSLGGALASRKLGKPFFLEVNADLLEQRKLKGKPEKGIRRVFAEWATQTCFNTAKRIICISSELADHLQHRWAIDSERLVVLPCAADTDAFSDSDQTERTRDELGLGDEPVVMWVGGFYRWHSLGLLIESFAEVRRSCPGVKLVLVGDGETRSQIEQQVAGKRLEHDVIFTGMVPHSQIPHMLSVADIVVAPAPALNAGHGGTGTPLKLFEYMAAGKPIVATAVNQAMEIIEDGETGILVEPDNAVAFASAIERLLVNPAHRTRLGENARRVAVKHHSWKNYAGQLERIYQTALCGPPA